jgi:hypothetical protein
LRQKIEEKDVHLQQKDRQWQSDNIERDKEKNAQWIRVGCVVRPDLYPEEYIIYRHRFFR